MTKLIQEIPEIKGFMEAVAQDDERKQDLRPVSLLLKQQLLNAEKNRSFHTKGGMKKF